MTFINRLAFLICLHFLPLNSVLAQPWLEPSNLRTSGPVIKKPDFKDIQGRFENYWSDKRAAFEEQDNARLGGYQQYKRWEWFMKPRTFPTGEFFNPEILQREYSREMKRQAASRSSVQLPQWSIIGPAVVPNRGGGSGRINVLRFHPSNPNIMFAGAASGGIWKTEDGGVTWTSDSDFLPVISIADIAINPRDPDTMYIATGDGYGYEVGGDFWGGTYSAGVMMSVDGGLTWTMAGLSYAQTQSTIIQRLVVHPSQPEILIAATRNGLFRSVNAGATWTQVRTGRHYDIEFNPANPNIVYASSNTSVVRSLNGGQTWSTLRSGLCGGRISIAVTPADADYIYAFCESGNLYKSDDAGATFATMNSPNAVTTFYGYYDAVLCVSPTNPLTVLCGGVGIALSTDGGNNWTSVGNNGPGTTIHVDQKFLEFYPGSSALLYATNDGGVYKSQNGGFNWTDISSNMAIKQYYRLSQSASDPYFIMAGAQDNGTDRLRNNQWDKVSGADGMECLIDYANPNNVYATYQYGNIRKSTDGGDSFTGIAPASGDWVTPFIIHPSNPQILFAGYSEVYKSTDGGLNWNTISSGQFGDDLTAMAIVPANPDVLYVSNLGKIFKTTDGGLNWTNITSNLPVSSSGITYIAVSAMDPNRVWISLTGYAAGNKVFTTANGGTTWTNISGSLPNVPVNCIVHEHFSDGALYVGTDFGVYYRDNLLSDWQAYNAALPHVIVNEMEIHYGSGKLRAATYGRGIWEVDLLSRQNFTLDAAVQRVNLHTLSACDSTVVPEVLLRNFGSDTLTTANLNILIDNIPYQAFPWTGSLAAGDSQSVVLPAIALNSGTYSISVIVHDPNGFADQNSLNNLGQAAITIDPNIVALPVVEDFQTIFWTWPPTNWDLDDAGQLFQPDYSRGGFGNSTVSLFASCFGNPGLTATLSSGKIPFQSVLAPARLTFSLAYAPYSNLYHDSLFVEVSTDCGISFTRVYAKGDNSLATSAAQTQAFLPQAGDWRTETVDLNSFIGADLLMLRFVAQSGNGNNIYLDDINILDGTSGIAVVEPSRRMLVFPNPVFDKAKLVLQSETAGFGRLMIYDVFGRRVGDKEIQVLGGYNEFPIDMSSYAKGIYRIIWSTPGEPSLNVSLVKN